MFSGSFIHITQSSPRRWMIAAYYMMASAFYAVVWFARLSIVFSIIRIHPSPTIRRMLFYVAGIFFLITVVLISQLYWVCEPQPGWKDEASPQCKLPDQVVILQLVTDIFADTILVAVPVRLIMTLSDKKLRRRLLVIFSTCLITTAVSLVHAAFIFVGAGHQEVMAAIAEDCVSLIVCNVPVVATVMIRKFSSDDRNPARKSRITNNKTLSLKFATLNGRAQADTAASTAQQTTTFGTGTGWFRWDRELPETESSEPNTSTVLSSVELTEATQQSGPTDTLDIRKPDSEPQDLYPPQPHSRDQDTKKVYWLQDGTHRITKIITFVF
uniref:Rhodopsin domain-containing protein n=1 Tax=Moniliophthora roreri TaxID=221103 RepID=A0A0W0FQ49_MONRR